APERGPTRPHLGLKLFTRPFLSAKSFEPDPSITESLSGPLGHAQSRGPYGRKPAANPQLGRTAQKCYLGKPVYRQNSASTKVGKSNEACLPTKLGLNKTRKI
ncbi:unnamed protein product, partial [Caenorhabditis auriculariae]